MGLWLKLFFSLCPDRSLFYEYKYMGSGRFFMGNNNMYKIIGIRSIKIRMFDGTIRTLHNVRHATRLKINLISLGMLDNLWYFLIFENCGLEIMKGTEIVMKKAKKNGLYVLEISSVSMSAAMLAVSDIDITKLWHLKLEHMSVKGMQELSKQGLLSRDKIH